MRTKTTDPTLTPKRRGRPRKVESYADWMARVDASVDCLARTMERQPPTYAYLHPAQRKIVQMLIEHMRSLPELREGESCFTKAEYQKVNYIITYLFCAKYPIWEQTPRCKSGRLDVNKIPNGEGADLIWMLRNCAGRAPVETASYGRDEDDD